MIRRATYADIPRIIAIRADVRENQLADPSRVTLADIRWFIDNPAIWVWEESGQVCGFSAGDPRDGMVFALFVDPAHEGKGIGQALLPHACGSLKAAGHTAATLTTAPGTRAERFYRRNGWAEIGRQKDGQIIFRRPI